MRATALVAKQAYVATTAHFIDEDWKLVSVGLACDPHYGAATAQAIYDSIRERWERYDLVEENLQCIVTDFAQNRNFSI
jgi:hypothetical protein